MTQSPFDTTTVSPAARPALESLGLRLPDGPLTYSTLFRLIEQAGLRPLEVLAGCERYVRDRGPAPMAPIPCDNRPPDTPHFVTVPQNEP